MSLIIEDYERISALTGQMRDAATHGEWDKLVSLELECRQKVEEIKPRDIVPTATTERQQKIALIKKILADDAEIRNRTEEWMGQLQRIMQSSRTEQRLHQAYQTNY